MARPRTHGLIAIGLAAGVWRATGRLWPALAALAGAFLVDGDHVVDYLVIRRTRQRNWLVVPLHAWEWVPLVLLAGRLFRRPALARGLALGLATHLALDQALNPVSQGGYSLLVRLRRGFRADRLGLTTGAHEWVEEPPWRWF